MCHNNIIHEYTDLSITFIAIGPSLQLLVGAGGGAGMVLAASLARL